jgi:UDP-N-acetylmuramoylalanine--D-glutamate ligase
MAGAWASQRADAASDELRVRGRHNAANALAALALVACALASLTAAAALRRLARIPAGRTGCSVVAEMDGVDATTTIPRAPTSAPRVAALERLCPGRVVLIAGGDGKGQDFAPLAAALARP